MQIALADVLVVGAGPVGLTMAAELARHGVSCRIVDKLGTPLPYCRAIGVTPRTLEVWDDMGIVQSMIDAGLWLRSTRTILNGSPTQDSVTDLSDLPYGGQLGIRQPETERLLTAHLASFGIAIERQVTLTALEQDEEGVRVELLHADQSTEKATYRYVVGCDGAHSSVRRLLGIPFEGDHFPIGFMLGDVVLDCDLPRGTILRSITPHEGGPPDFIVAIPLPERNRYRVSMLAPERNVDTAGSEHGMQTEGPTPTLEELQAVADRLLPTKVTMSDLHWSSNFRISMRLAARYSEGRGFIAGDAAHIHPPTGGQGMNTGIQDAYNLAWKMAHVLKGNASPKLLDTYEAERRPVGADVVSRTRTASEQFGRKEAVQQERLADTQMLVNYRESELSKNELGELAEDLAVQAGDRAPDCFGLRRENVQAPFRLFDVMRGIDSVLLFYVGQTLDAQQIEILESMAQMLKSTWRPRCRVVAIFAAEAKLSDIIGVSMLTDSAGGFADAYAPAISTGYLIRPDGYVGYHARPMTEQGLATYLAAMA
jgi:2-polyprenyl-6-methoxyphenol hydroxylase-like FAD-dependent oxidoreductase